MREARTRPRERSTQNANKLVGEKQRLSVDKIRLERWKATGVIALSDCNLKVWSEPSEQIEIVIISFESSFASLIGNSQ